MKKPTLCVIFGGKSTEYAVSLRSAYGILNSIDGERYDVIRVGITREGKWLLFEGDNGAILNDTWHVLPCPTVTLDLSRGCLIVLGGRIYSIDVELFFPVLHGEYGEDGRLQGLFDIAGAKYVGCKAFASHVCMDKQLTKRAAAEMGIRVADGVCIGEGEESRACEFCAKIGYPVFVKPVMSGSSVGASLVESEGELPSALERAFRCCKHVLVEEYIRGKEAEVAVMQSKQGLKVTRVGMIRHGARFYDYDAKYSSPTNEYLIPAPIGDRDAEYIRESARRLFLFLGCTGLSRFDFFVTECGAVFNEVNTMPGFTDISMFPKLFTDYGYTYKETVNMLIENAL